MKIGIVTYHRTLNYGGCLQALATRLILEKMGHEVYYIDYWPEYHANEYKRFSWCDFHKRSLLGKYRYLKRRIKYHKSDKKFRLAFERFHKKFTYPYCRKVTERYDAVVYGSDQIWRKQSYGDYNPFYFGNNNIKSNRHVAFSASMGNLPLTTDEKERVYSMVKHIDIISVREEDLQTYLIQLGFDNVKHTLDPTLCISSSLWDKVFPSEEYTGRPYVLLYLLRGGFDENEVRKYANEHGYELKILKGNGLCEATDETINTAGPADFIHLIKNASIVFTSSFHGLAFSLIFQREVFASFRSNGSRGLSLLSAVGIPERFLEPQSAIPTRFTPIDYNKVYSQLGALREHSLEFLKKSIVQ